MNPGPDLFRAAKKPITLSRGRVATTSSILVFFFFVSMAWSVSAQTITWTDRFVQGETPTVEQCRNWSNFLSQLEGKRFASVTMSGEFDQTGKSITDPAVATELATLLSSKTPGTVRTDDGHTWTVTNCDVSVCHDGYSISLSVDGNTEQCDCKDTYTIRPQSKNQNWGGINTTTSCGARSQSMKLEFHSGVSIIPQGSTYICEGGSVVLTASTKVCSPVESYLWSNNETGPSITVSQPGFYSVTVFGKDGCEATSAPTEVAFTDVKVAAGPDAVYCEGQPVQLNATGTSLGTGSTMVNKVCLFDAPGWYNTVNCDFSSPTICDDATIRISGGVYTKMVSFSSPVELRYKLYQSARAVTDFIFKLNGHQIGTYQEKNTSGACIPIGDGGAPYVFSFSADKFKKYWLDGAENALTIEVISTGTVNLAGLAVDVVTSDESYVWSPSDGLDVASIKNPVATPEDSMTYTVTYTDASGCTATDKVKVDIKCNVPPVVVCKEVAVSVESTDKATVEAMAFDGGSSSPDGATLSFSAWPAGPYPVGTTDVTFTVTDSNGESSTCQTKITVTDSGLPVIVAPDDLVVWNDAGACSATLELVPPETSDNCGVANILNDHDGNLFKIGENTVTWTATDIHGNQAFASQKVTVVNDVPEISVSVASSSVVTNTPVGLTIGSTDNNLSKATINWGDNSDIETIDVSGSVFEASHAYVNSGFYSVTITAIDMCGSSTYHYESIVVSPPPSGTVAGGGWFNSPRGASVEDPRAAGKATFAFEVSNQNRNRVSQGHIVFNFKEGSLRFRSTDFEWLYIEDKTARMQAVGRLNGERGYKILLSVVEIDGTKHGDDWDDDDSRGRHDDDWDDDDRRHSDRDRDPGDKDRIRVKIWDPTGVVIYDTQLGSPDEAIATSPLNGGSIKIHQKETSFDSKYESPVATSFGGESSSVYPNPFTDWVDIQFSSGSHENVAIQIMDMSGKVVYSKVFPVSEDGKYPVDMPEYKKAEPGIYVVVIKQGKKVEFLRLVRE